MIVIVFTTRLKADIDMEDYNRWSERMVALVEQQPGFISRTSLTAPDGDEVTIARFASEEAVKAWRAHPEHLQAQRLGQSTFYASYRVEVCTTIREYEFPY
jgi:heme-degrading monooxygenase HmoA